MSVRWFVYFSPFLLIACGDWRQVTQAQDAVARQLAAPAAEFRDVKLVTAANGTKYVCGAVKGEARPGDYGGFRDFVYSLDTAEVLLAPSATVTSQGREVATASERQERDFAAKRAEYCAPG